MGKPILGNACFHQIHLCSLFAVV